VRRLVVLGGRAVGGLEFFACFVRRGRNSLGASHSVDHDAVELPASLCRPQKRRHRTIINRPTGHPHRGLSGGERRLPREGPRAHREAPEGRQGAGGSALLVLQRPCTWARLHRRRLLGRDRLHFILPRPPLCHPQSTPTHHLSTHSPARTRHPPSIHPPSVHQAAGKDVSMDVHDDRGLLALQGPSAAKVLQAMTKQDLSKFYFGNFARFEVAGVPCWVTRTG